MVLFALMIFFLKIVLDGSFLCLFLLLTFTYKKNYLEGSGDATSAPAAHLTASSIKKSNFPHM
jgi:hypothetical protein